MEDWRKLYGPRTSKSSWLGYLPPTKNMIKERFEKKYDESVIKIFKLFEDKRDNVRGWLIIMDSRVIYYLDQDATTFSESEKIIWIIDDIRNVKIQLKNDNVLKLNEKELIFSLEEYSPKALVSSIKKAFREVKIKPVKSVIYKLKYFVEWIFDQFSKIKFNIKIW